MATKRIKKNQVGEALSAPAGLDYKPSLHLDLEGADLKQIEGIKVGEEVEIIVRGKVRRVSQEKRQRYDYEKNKQAGEVHTGTISIDNYSIVRVEDEKNEFVKLADDEDEAAEPA